MIEQLNDALKNSQPQTSEGAFRPFFLKFILNFKKKGLKAPFGGWRVRENSVKTTKKPGSPIVKITSLRIFIVKKIPNLGYF